MLTNDLAGSGYFVIVNYNSIARKSSRVSAEVACQNGMLSLIRPKTEKKVWTKIRDNISKLFNGKTLPPISTDSLSLLFSD